MAVSHRTKARVAFCVAGTLLVLATLTLVLCFWLHGRSAVLEPSPVSADEPVVVDADGFPEVDWDYWQGINADVIGWVSVPQTNIDYPIVQAPADDPSYYLYHDIYRSWSYMGCPYLDAGCADAGLLDSHNAVIFGHNLGYGDHSLFADFATYTDAAYATDHQTILLQTPTHKVKLSAFAATCIGGWDASKRTSFKDTADFTAYRSLLYEGASVQLAEPSARLNTMFTFVTCSYNYWDNERTLVFADSNEGNEG